jgi:hypothetical protein
MSHKKVVRREWSCDVCGARYVSPIEGSELPEGWATREAPTKATGDLLYLCDQCSKDSDSSVKIWLVAQELRRSDERRRWRSPASK